MVLIIALNECERKIYNIVFRYLISTESEVRDRGEPMNYLNNTKSHVIIDHNNVPVGYMEMIVKDKKYHIIELIEIFPMFRGNSYARDTILELERQGKNIIISHPLSFPQWINIMGIEYWFNKVKKLGTRTLLNLMSYSSNGNYDEDKLLSKLLRRLLFEGMCSNYMQWEEYINMVRLDPTIILHEYDINMIPYEYYAIRNDGIVICKVLYNGNVRPLIDKEIFILNTLDIQYEYEKIPTMFDVDNLLLVDYLNTLGIGTRHITNKHLTLTNHTNTIKSNKMTCNDGSILYWDQLYRLILD